ncbi:MAG TPA: 6-bladed beta-propeller [Longimicrobiaceae bacterium]|nr:6-bladed beta-propeller [Longimicrobiaceae bacterium]
MPSAVLRTSILAALAAGLLAAPAAQAQQNVRLPEKDRPLALRTTPVFAVGTAEGRDHEMFTRVDQVAFDRNDNLYVLDGGGNRVLVFDPAGRFVRQVGKKGGGPGEFQAPVGLAVQSDGALAVADLARRSYSLFGPDGKYLRSVPFAEEWMPMAVGSGAMAAHPRGGVVAAVRPAPAMRLDGAARRADVRSTPIFWQPFTAGAEPVRLFDAPTELNVQSQASQQPGGGQRVSFRTSVPVFSPRVNWGVRPGGGLVVSHTPGYTLKVLDAEGRVERYVQRPVRTRKVTERDRSRERERRRQSMLSGEGMRVTVVGGSGGAAPRVPGISKEEIEEMVRTLEFAETIPAIQNLRVDGAGRLWVERTGEAWGEPGPIDVVGADGRYLGTVTGQRLPAAFSASGRAAYVETDDLGVQRVVVRQLPRL